MWPQAGEGRLAHTGRLGGRCRSVPHGKLEVLLKEAWWGHRRRTGMQLSLGLLTGGQAANDLEGAARGLRPRLQAWSR